MTFGGGFTDGSMGRKNRPSMLQFSRSSIARATSPTMLTSAGFTSSSSSTFAAAAERGLIKKRDILLARVTLAAAFPAKIQEAQTTISSVQASGSLRGSFMYTRGQPDSSPAVASVASGLNGKKPTQDTLIARIAAHNEEERSRLDLRRIMTATEPLTMYSSALFSRSQVAKVNQDSNESEKSKKTLKYHHAPATNQLPEGEKQLRTLMLPLDLHFLPLRKTEDFSQPSEFRCCGNNDSDKEEKGTTPKMLHVSQIPSYQTYVGGGGKRQAKQTSNQSSSDHTHVYIETLQTKRHGGDQRLKISNQSGLSSVNPYADTFNGTMNNKQSMSQAAGQRLKSREIFMMNSYYLKPPVENSPTTSTIFSSRPDLIQSDKRQSKEASLNQAKTKPTSLTQNLQRHEQTTAFRRTQLHDIHSTRLPTVPLPTEEAQQQKYSRPSVSNRSQSTQYSEDINQLPEQQQLVGRSKEAVTTITPITDPLHTASLDETVTAASSCSSSPYKKLLLLQKKANGQSFYELRSYFGRKYENSLHLGLAGEETQTMSTKSTFKSSARAAVAASFSPVKVASKPIHHTEVGGEGHFDHHFQAWESNLDNSEQTEDYHLSQFD